LPETNNLHVWNSHRQHAARKTDILPGADVACDSMFVSIRSSVQ